MRDFYAEFKDGGRKELYKIKDDAVPTIFSYKKKTPDRRLSINCANKSNKRKLVQELCNNDQFASSSSSYASFGGDLSQVVAIVPPPSKIDMCTNTDLSFNPFIQVDMCTNTDLSFSPFIQVVAIVPPPSKIDMCTNTDLSFNPFIQVDMCTNTDLSFSPFIQVVAIVPPPSKIDMCTNTDLSFSPFIQVDFFIPDNLDYGGNIDIDNLSDSTACSSERECDMSNSEYSESEPNFESEAEIKHDEFEGMKFITFFSSLLLLLKNYLVCGLPAVIEKVHAKGGNCPLCEIVL